MYATVVPSFVSIFPARTFAMVRASSRFTSPIDSGGTTSCDGIEKVCRLALPPFRPSSAAFLGSEWKKQRLSLCGLALQRSPLEVVALHCTRSGFERLSGMGDTPYAKLTA